MNTRRQKNRNKSLGTRKPLDGSSGKGRVANSLFTIALASVLGATLLITAVVYFTPLDDSTDPALAQLPASDGGQDGKAEKAAERDGGETTSGSVTVRRGRLAALEFPDEPAPIEVGELQTELRELALRLQRDYPEESGAFHFAAQIYFELNQTEEAEQAWRKSISLPSPASGPYAGLGQLLVNDGREVEAIELLEQALAAGTRSAEMLLQLAVAHENLGQLEEAQATLAEGVAEFPDFSDLWLAQGRVLNQLGKYETAEQSILRSMEQGGESENALFLLTTARLRQGKRELAAETRERLQSLRDRAGQPSTGFQEGYESALRAIALDVLISSAALAEKVGRLEEAEEFLWRAIHLAPDSGQAYMSLSSVLRRQGKLQHAVQVHQQLVLIQPDNMLNYSNLASIALQNGEIELARRTLLDATQVDPDGVMAQALLARLYLAEQQFGEAKKYARLVLERNRSVESYLLLASIYQAEGNIAAAQEAISAAQGLDPQHPIWKSE